MTKFELWFFKRIAKQEVRQGYQHAGRISEMYQIIRDAARAEFTEDNDPTLNSFLRDCFENHLDGGKCEPVN